MSKFFRIAATAVLLFVAFSGCEKKRELPPVTNTEFVRYNTGITMPSEILGRNITFSVLFPKSYRDEKEARYPVVYMLHGYGEGDRDWSNWVSVIKQLEGSGMQPMIYIFPNCGNSYYSNTFDGRAKHMDMFVDELVPFVDKAYRTIADREHRAVMGYSMGGFGAMVLPLKNPDVFGISVPLSMSFRTDEQYMNESQDGWNNQWGSIFGGKGQMGAGRLTDYYKEHCPFYQFVPENKEELSQVKWFFHCGDDEEQLLIANDNLHVQLRDYGYEHEFRIGNGGHSGDYWRSAARETLPWIEHVMNDGGKWEKIIGEISEKTSELNEDGSFESNTYKAMEEKSGLAIYLAHNGLSKEMTDKVTGMISQSGQHLPYMILPCDLSEKTLGEWMAEYSEKYCAGGSADKSHIIAFGDAGRQAYELQEQFSAYYYIDADIAEDNGSITADPAKFYYIDQTDDSENYQDMNALYRACMDVISDIDDRNFEYRMRNGQEDMETNILLAAKSLADNIKYQ